MTDQEVNEIIAEFMDLGISFHQLHKDSFDVQIKNSSMGKIYERYPRYDQSLDALVPVWEKLDKHKRTAFEGILLGYCFDKKPLHTASFFDYGYFEGIVHYHSYGAHETIQQAAAHATAKAILELKDGK